MVSLASLAPHLKYPGELSKAFVVAIVTASVQFWLPLAAKSICGVSITAFVDREPRIGVFLKVLFFRGR